MHNPGVIISKAIQRTRYNTGRVLKEAGLSKLYLLLIYDSHGPFWIKNAE